MVLSTCADLLKVSITRVDKKVLEKSLRKGMCIWMCNENVLQFLKCRIEKKIPIFSFFPKRLGATFKTHKIV